MNSITELRNELAQVFQQVKTGDLKPQISAQLNHCASRIISSVRVELEYYSARKEKPQIQYMQKPKGRRTTKK